MRTDDVIWSIDFCGTDEDAAETIADSAKRLGLATDVIISPPDVFMTVHMDMDTVVALREALSQGESSGGVPGLVHMLDEWLAERGAP